MDRAHNVCNPMPPPLSFSLSHFSLLFSFHIISCFLCILALSFSLLSCFRAHWWLPVLKVVWILKMSLRKILTVLLRILSILPQVLSLSLVPLFLYFCNISYFFSPSLPHIFPSFFLSHFSLKLITLFLIPPGMSKEQAQAMARKIGFTTSCIDRVSLCVSLLLLLLFIIIIIIDTVVYRQQSRWLTCTTSYSRKIPQC